MSTTRQIYKEATHVLYENRTFSFGSNVEAVVPFFSDLTPTTRQLIKNIFLLERGSLYTRDYDQKRVVISLQVSMYDYVSHKT